MTKILSKKTTVEVYEYIDDTAVPVEPVEPINDDPFKDAPDLDDNNHNSNGDVLVPYIYNKNNWNVKFNLDIGDRNSLGLFNMKVLVTSAPAGVIKAKLVVYNLANEAYSNYNLYDYVRNTDVITKGQEALFDVKTRVVTKSGNAAYDLSNWGTKTYMYVWTPGHLSGVFYMMPMDTGSGYKRID